MSRYGLDGYRAMRSKCGHGEDRFFVKTKLDGDAVFSVADLKKELTMECPGTRGLSPTSIHSPLLNKI